MVETPDPRTTLTADDERFGFGTRFGLSERAWRGFSFNGG